jgi:hypothetical protein
MPFLRNNQKDCLLFKDILKDEPSYHKKEFSSFRGWRTINELFPFVSLAG